MSWNDLIWGLIVLAVLFFTLRPLFKKSEKTGSCHGCNDCHTPPKGLDV